MAGNSPGRGGALRQFYRWVFGIGHERNVGGTERALRYAGGTVCVLAGLAVLAVPVLGGGLDIALGLVLVATGGYLIYEARVQYCPLNHTLARSTYCER